jgi:hypothetical protein
MTITVRDYNSLGNALRRRILRAAAVDGCHVYIRMTSSGWRIVAVDPTLDKSGARRQELTNRGYALVVGIGRPEPATKG